jgi:hypothetical protein
MSTPETPHNRIGRAKRLHLNFSKSPSIDTASTVSSPTTSIESHERDLLETLLYSQPRVVHCLIRHETQNLEPVAAIEQICAGIMRQKLGVKTVFKMFCGDTDLAKTIVVRWSDTLAIIKETIDVEKLVLSRHINIVLGLAAFSLMSLNLGGRRRAYVIPRIARECGEWAVAEIDFV